MAEVRQWQKEAKAKAKKEAKADKAKGTTGSAGGRGFLKHSTKSSAPTAGPPPPPVDRPAGVASREVGESDTDGWMDGWMALPYTAVITSPPPLPPPPPLSR